MEKASVSTSAAFESQELPRHPTPPPYSGPSTSVVPATLNISEAEASSRRLPRYPGLPKLDYRLYSPPLFNLSKDCKSLLSRAEHLSTNADALVTLVRTQATVPPKPQIHIQGTHDNGSEVDFNIKLNLMGLLVADDERQRLDYIRCVGENELAYRGGTRPDVLPEVGDAGLEEWCSRYVQDKSSIKSFALDRVVVNLDTEWIEGQIRTLIASLKYRGTVSVKFVVTHDRVLVQNPDKVNHFFTSVTGLFSGKNKYEVVKAVWPFATTKNGEAGRRCMVQSEEVWWRDWRGPIKHAIAQRRKGWVTVEDRLEAVMEGKGDEDYNMSSGFDSGK